MLSPVSVPSSSGTHNIHTRLSYHWCTWCIEFPQAAQRTYSYTYDVCVKRNQQILYSTYYIHLSVNRISVNYKLSVWFYIYIFLQTELDETESRNEEYPLSRAMLHLLDVLTDVAIPRLLGVGTRTPGFDPYLHFIVNSVFLGFNTRSYRNPAEKVQ